MAANINVDTQVVAVRTSISSGLSFADAVISLANQLHSDDNAFGSAALLDTGISQGNVPILGTNGILDVRVIPNATATRLGGVQLATNAEAIAGTNASVAMTPANITARENARGGTEVLSEEVYLTFPRTAPQDRDFTGTYTIPTGLSKIVLKIAGAGGGGGPQGSRGTGTGNNAPRNAPNIDSGGDSSVVIGTTTITSPGGYPGAGGSSYDGRAFPIPTNATTYILGAGAPGGQGGTFRGVDDREIEGQNGLPGCLAIYSTTNPPSTMSYTLGKPGEPGQEQGSSGAFGSTGYIIVQLYRRI